MTTKRAVTREALQAVNTGFKATFAAAFAAAAPKYQTIAEVVNSTAGIETYAWLGQIPGMREWIGERHIKDLTEEAYTLKNRKFEGTVSVPREAIEDDTYSIYAPAIRGMAQAAAEHPDELVFEALKRGFEVNCYDGQYFFDTDHPVTGADSKEVAVSNVQAGAGPAWFLLCTNRAVKPLVYQDRIKAELIINDDPAKSERVFMSDQFVYGTRSRGAAGYTYWQMAFASKAELTAENFEAARAAMASLKGDAGRPLNIVPNLLVVPPALETAAKRIVGVETINGGNNPNYKLAEVLMTPWLA